MMPFVKINLPRSWNKMVDLERCLDRYRVHRFEKIKTVATKKKNF